MRIRPGRVSDLEVVTQMSAALWPTAPAAEHSQHAKAVLSGEPPSDMPLVLIVAESVGDVVGFIEVGLRSHADDCDTRYPVGFIEGWCVQPHFQRRGVGRAL